SLAQEADTPQSRPIEATGALNILVRNVAAAGALVDLLHAHAGPEGTSIDIFANRVDALAGAGRTTLTRGQIARVLAAAQGPVRLYGFSNVLYHDVVQALGEHAVMEMSVPRALQDAAGHWSPEFLALGAERA